MKTRMVMASAALAGAAILIGQMNADAVSARQKASSNTSSGGNGLIVEPIAPGPDIITGSLQSMSLWGTSGGIAGYTAGTTSCNIGTQNANWQQGVQNMHPLIHQNIYRLAGGRFEQLGQGWIKHSFCALQNPLTGCGTCNGGGGCLSVLTPGCSDPYTAARNALVSLLGPRTQINAATGTQNVQYTSANQPVGVLPGQVQVATADLSTTTFPGARFFIEGIYVASDDTAATNHMNNASWREFTVNQGSFSPTLLSTGATQIGGTNRQQVAMHAWLQFDTGAGPSPNVPVTMNTVDVPSDGRFILGYKVTNNGNNTWTYEYALMNYNSDRSGHSFSVPVGSATLSNIGFHDVDYHSANGTNAPVYNGTDWPSNVSGGNITWASHLTFAQSANANALRYLTLYNFRFTANSAPTAVNATIGLFKPGSPTSVTIATHGPSGGVICQGGGCQSDLNGSGSVNGLDLGILLAGWSIPAGSPGCQGTTPCCADFNGDGVVNGLDLGILLGDWEGIPGGNPACP